LDMVCSVKNMQSVRPGRSKKARQTIRFLR
jgi:hypothetical protein